MAKVVVGPYPHHLALSLPVGACLVYRLAINVKPGLSPVAFPVHLHHLPAFLIVLEILCMAKLIPAGGYLPPGGIGVADHSPQGSFAGAKVTGSIVGILLFSSLRGMDSGDPSCLSGPFGGQGPDLPLQTIGQAYLYPVPIPAFGPVAGSIIGVFCPQASPFFLAHQVPLRS